MESEPTLSTETADGSEVTDDALLLPEGQPSNADNIIAHESENEEAAEHVQPEPDEMDIDETASNTGPEESSYIGDNCLPTPVDTEENSPHEPENQLESLLKEETEEESALAQEGSPDQSITSAMQLEGSVEEGDGATLAQDDESSTMDEDMGDGEGVASSDDVNDISSAAQEAPSALISSSTAESGADITSSGQPDAVLISSTANGPSLSLTLTQQQAEPSNEFGDADTSEMEGVADTMPAASESMPLLSLTSNGTSLLSSTIMQADESTAGGVTSSMTTDSVAHSDTSVDMEDVSSSAVAQANGSADAEPVAEPAPEEPSATVAMPITFVTPATAVMAPVAPATPIVTTKPVTISTPVRIVTPMTTVNSMSAILPVMKVEPTEEPAETPTTPPATPLPPADAAHALATLASAALHHQHEQTEPETKPIINEEDAWYTVDIVKGNSYTVQNYISDPNIDLSNLSLDKLPDLSNYAKIPLEHGTAYKFRIAAINSCGIGDFSEESAFKTCLPGFPGAPSAIKISKSVEGAHLSWEPPQVAAEGIFEYSVYLAVRSNTQPKESAKSQLAFVRVYCGKMNTCVVPQSSLSAAHVDSSTKPAIIFRIAARNEKGYGPATQVRWLQDISSVAMKRPGDTRLTGASPLKQAKQTHNK